MNLFGLFYFGLVATTIADMDDERGA
jgi:hypothetical protein